MVPARDASPQPSQAVRDALAACRFTVGGRPGGAYGGVLQRGAGLAVGVVPAEARARRVTQPGCLSLNSLGGGLRPRLLRAAGGVRGAATYPRGAGPRVPHRARDLRGAMWCRPRHDKKSGAGRGGMPGPGHMDGTLFALTRPCQALPAFANHGWSWRRKMAAISSADTP
jgi:hypothetical protein